MKRMFFVGWMVVWTLAFRSAAASDLKLWYEGPATRWEEALPLGNGAAAAAGRPGVDSAGPHRNAPRATAHGLPEEIPLPAAADVPGPVPDHGRRTDSAGAVGIPAPPEDLRARRRGGDRSPAR